MTNRPLWTSAVVMSGAVICGAAALGQNISQQPGTLLTATITSALEANDNYDLSDTSPGDAMIWTNTLRFDIESTTAIDQLSATVSGDLRYADLPVIGTDTSLDNGTFSTRYNRNIDDNSLTLNAFYNDADLEFLDPLRTLDENGDFDDTLGTGRRALTIADFQLILSEDGPLRFQVDGAVRDTEYRDTTVSSLNDKTRTSLNTEVRFDISPITQGVVGARFYNLTEDGSDGRDENSQRYETGLIAELSSILTLDARIGYQKLDIKRDDESDHLQERAVGSVSLVLDRPNGQASFDFSSYLTENGMRNEMLFGRNFTLPAGAFSASAGLSNSKGTEVRPVVNLGYQIARPTSTFDLAYRQTINVDDDGNDVLSAVLNANYSHRITPISSFGLAANAAQRSQLDEDSDENDVTRLTLEAKYNHSLTPDWELSTGYRHRSRIEDSADDATSNAVFLNLTRSFRAKR